VKPTLAADELRRNLMHYLTTMFTLAEQPVRDALEEFLNDPDQGIFRGPYLRIRTSFRHAEDGGRIIPDGLQPGIGLSAVRAWACGDDPARTSASFWP
jgi:hypothetical protein